MPIYEYECPACRRRVSLFFRSLATVEADPACPRCGARGLTRRMSRFWSMSRGDDYSLSAADFDAGDEGPTGDPWDDGDDLESAAESFDPVAFAREARTMAALSGETLDAPFEHALRHIEAGADPEDVLGELDASESAAEPVE